MAKTRKARKPPTFIQAHAHELISRHGPRTIGMIAHSFANLGNPIPGNSPDEQWAAIEKELIADPRMLKVSENPGRGLDWYGLKEGPIDEEDETEVDEAEQLPQGEPPAPAVPIGTVMAEQSEPEAEEPASEAPSPVAEPKAPDDSKKDPTNGRRK